MKTFALICLVAMVGGVLVAATMIASWPAPASGAPTAAAPISVSDEGSLRAEVAALAERTDLMAMPVETLQTRIAAVQQEEIDEMLGLLAAARDPETGSEQLEELVLNVIDAKEDRERDERDERRREAMEERMETRIAELTEELGLNGYQAGEMNRILTTEQTSREEFFSKMREDGTCDRQAIRDGMQEIRTKTRAQAQVVLSTSQYDQYVESKSGFGGGRRGEEGGNRARRAASAPSGRIGL